MSRHPIVTLRTLVEMGAKECCLSQNEVLKLIDDYEYLFYLANKDPGMVTFLDPKSFGIDKK